MEMEIERMWGGLLTMEEQLDLMIDLFNVFNPILCNRIDGNEIILFNHKTTA